MLPRRHRIVDGFEFRRIQRSGSKKSTDFFVVYIRPHDELARFGFIAGKEVGGAVVRNRARRQLRHCASRSIHNGLVGHDVVVRILASAAGATSQDLEQAWSEVFTPLETR